MCVAPRGCGTGLSRRDVGEGTLQSHRAADLLCVMPRRFCVHTSRYGATYLRQARRASSLSCHLPATLYLIISAWLICVRWQEAPPPRRRPVPCIAHTPQRVLCARYELYGEVTTLCLSVDWTTAESARKCHGSCQST